MMRRILMVVGCSILAGSALLAQVTPAFIQASGTATINVQPDQAQLTVGVVTQGATAQEAATQNATLSTAVQNALKATLGTSGTIQTVSYSIYPRYSNSQTPVILGYTASNSVQVTTNNLGIIGSLIDTANQAGANNVSGISFGLQNLEPATLQALSQAAKQALAHAAAIASGVGGKIGAVISSQEGSSYTPMAFAGSAPTAAATPVQTGTVGVSASVSVTVALVP